ncbi:MAG: YidC/Oxa1 family membrane protein insertase [Clostridia bacterium]|nr:YidC/Oxa1 family membrane protein insertase [Clostridia bacterium]
MFNLCASIFGFVLNFIYGIVNNYGIAIIIFTIVLKLILLPMSLKQQKTMKKTAKLQKQVREIQDKYASDPTRMNQEVMDLYKKENMSPFSGCLTSILQFVVVLSMFYLVSKPLTYMLNVDQTILNDYTTKLQQESEENNAIRYPEIAIIKNFADKDERVNINMEFLGLDLSDVPSSNRDDWKVFIIPVLYVLTSIASMKITTALNNSGKTNKEEKKVENTKLPEKVENKDDTAEMMEQMNKNMNFMMPIMTVSIAIIAPLGLALYWFLSNLLSILERLFVYKFVKSEEE